MIIRILVYCIVSITLIYILHQFIEMLRDNLTNTKVVDLVHSPNHQYSKIYNTLYDTNKQSNLKQYFNELTNSVDDKSTYGSDGHLQHSPETISFNVDKERFDKKEDKGEEIENISESIPFSFSNSNLKYDSL